MPKIPDHLAQQYFQEVLAPVIGMIASACEQAGFPAFFVVQLPPPPDSRSTFGAVRVMEDQMNAELKACVGICSGEISIIKVAGGNLADSSLANAFETPENMELLKEAYEGRPVTQEVLDILSNRGYGDHLPPLGSDIREWNLKCPCPNCVAKRAKQDAEQTSTLETSKTDLLEGLMRNARNN